MVTTASPWPWKCEEDRANERYVRVHDLNGHSIARVYYPERDAAVIRFAPELRALIRKIANGEFISRETALRYYRLAGGTDL